MLSIMHKNVVGQFSVHVNDSHAKKIIICKPIFSNWTTFRFANQFWSDPSFISSYYEATFRPHAALPGEVTLLIPNIFNVGETVPVNVPRTNLLNVYMTIFREQLREADIIEEDDDGLIYD